MKKYLLFLGLLGGTAALTSCEKYLDVNNNPNNPVVSTPNFLLPGIISNGIQTQMFTALRTPYITQYVVSRTANSGGNDQYYFTNAQSTNTFNYSYFQSGGNIPPMIAAAQAEGSAYYVGAGKIMQALILAHATDMLGDVPYTEAYQGGSNYTPKYDSQQQIYATINQLCDEGIVEMQKPASANFRPLYSTSPSESGDILYKGDVTKWVRMAYTLKARQAQHLTKKQSYDPAAVLALCEKGLASSADDAQINFQTPVLPLANTTSIFGVTRSNFGGATFSANVVKYLNGTTYPGVVDPRWGILVPTTSTGIDPGLGTAAVTTGINVTPSSSPAVTDFYGGWYARDLGYFEVLTYHELKFIQAEAYYRAGNLQQAYNALREGVRANMVKVGGGGTYSPPSVTFPTITTTQINAYLASAAMPQTPSAVTLRQIMEQKYLAMFLNPDVWSDLRRFDFRSDIYVNFAYPSRANPVLAAGTTATTRFPRRLLPGATEVTYNPTAVAKLFSDAGVTTNDDYTAKPLWFDQP